MKIIKLLTLEIENFKGIAHSLVHFDGIGLSIYGMNGAGKTTHYDALCWVLFGKDSRGNMPDTPDFQIKPHGTNGAGIMPTVTAVLEVDGEKVKLQKVFKEKWERKRGAADAVFTGNTTDCYIDEVPRKISEYSAQVSDIVPENSFQMLTDAHYFAEKMNWQQRRALLFEMCGTQSDAELLHADAQFALLAQEIGRLSIEDFKTTQSTRRRKLNATLKELPARIDECEKLIEDFSALDFAKIQQEIQTQEDKQRQLSGQLVQIENDTALAAAQNVFVSLQNEAHALENENNAHRASQQVPVTDMRKETQRKLNAVIEGKKSLSVQLHGLQTQIQNAGLRLEEYRTHWKAIDSEQFTDDICPTCGQKLPQAQIEKAQARMSDEKKRRQDALLQDSNLIKTNIAQWQEQGATLEQKIAALTQQETALASELESIKTPEQPTITDLPEYAAKRQEYAEKIAQAATHIRALQQNSSVRKAEIQQEITNLATALATLRMQLAKQDSLQQARKRQDEIRQQQRDTAAELEKIEKLIYLCEEFTRYKSDQLTANINSHFNDVEFQLFRQLKNGGLEDCCEIMLDGKPYGTISTGEKARVGLSIIETLSDYYGIQVPLFVDGCESITQFPEMHTQVIKLVVSEKDEKLRYLA